MTTMSMGVRILRYTAVKISKLAIHAIYTHMYILIYINLIMLESVIGHSTQKMKFT
jgi:hypothetical protein